MPTISIRWYYEDDVRRWERLEAKGKLGPQQATMLASWRRLKAANPTMESMEVSGGICYRGALKSMTKADAHAG